ncbi:hypothetical protein I317_05542 [Kwoniella heveanensis CBS 569]|nr:hypothetical protein I317_05542 [Kwoniella heveanensis CBS 569]
MLEKLLVLNGAVEQLRLPMMIEVIISALALLVWWIIKTAVWKPLTSPLRRLPHPPGGRSLEGHTGQIMDLHSSVVHEWIDTLGPTFRVNGTLGLHHRLFTLDPRALNHILSQTDIYTKSPLLRDLVRRYMKEGLIVSEGERHRIQRKVVQRLFSRNGLRGMGAVVQDKANQLRDIISDLCANHNLSAPYADPSSSSAETPDISPQTVGGREVDIYSASTRSTYDIIGEIAIDMPFDSLGDWESEIGRFYQRFEKMQMPSSGMRMMLGLLIPWVEVFWPSESFKAITAAMEPLEELAKRMMIERQREIDEGKREAINDNRDLLTLMLRSNMAKGMTSDQKLREEEITGQLATFMFAGSDTTAGTIAFGMYQLAQHRDIQDQLRAEVFPYGDNLPYEQMDDLPFLDAVVKEILRINPSLPGTVRQAAKDDIIPLAQPVTLMDGKVVSELKIRKGQIVHIPIEHLHTCTSIWGDRAAEFDPSRFLNMSLGQSTASPGTPQTATFPSSTWPGSAFSFSALTYPPPLSASSTSASASGPGSPLTPTFEEGVSVTPEIGSEFVSGSSTYNRKRYTYGGDSRQLSGFSDLGSASTFGSGCLEAAATSSSIDGRSPNDATTTATPTITANRRGSAPLLDQHHHQTPSGTTAPPAPTTAKDDASQSCGPGSSSSATANARRRSSTMSTSPDANANANPPGVWPNFMTFIDGPRRCIGYKLAIMEIKIMLFTLIREFEVEACEDKVIRRWNM